jgi:excisionase family DNA binding protein
MPQPGHPSTNGRQSPPPIPPQFERSARGRGITRADVMHAADVAVLLDVPKSTVDDWARRGVVPSRKRGRRRLFLRWEIEDWLVAEDD